MKSQWKLIVSLIILIFVVVFALQNTNVVPIDLFFAKYNIPLVLVILLSLLLGVIVGLVASFSAITMYKKERASAQKELHTVKESNLREIADKDREITHLRTQFKELKDKKQNTLSVPDTEQYPEIVE